MALHPNLQSMLNESLLEMLLVAKYCVEFHKDTSIWPSGGCYGYPAALMLLSIVDGIGSYVEQGNVESHFKILNNPEYYGLALSKEELKIVFANYRNLLSHHTVIATNVVLNIGSPSDRVLEKKDGKYWLNLVPFCEVSVKAVNSLLNNPNVLNNNKTILTIYKKSLTK